MNNKKKILYGILIGSLIVAILSLILGSPDVAGLCNKNDLVCIHGYIDFFGPIMLPFFVFSLPVFIVAIILLFLKEQIFNVWAKFAIIYIPISIILISIASPMGDLLFPSSKEMLTFLLPAIFFFASIALIIFQSRKLRKK